MSTPDPDLTGAGLSATGTTADDAAPGEPGPGNAYGGPGGTGSEQRETTGADEGDDAGQTADGDVEGAPR